MRAEPTFDHDRLEAYQVARQANREIAKLVRGLPVGTAEVADQLKRASLSIALNTAEGAGDLSLKEKGRFYTIASRSARECAAVLDHLVDIGILAQASVRPAQALLARTVAMLFKLTRSCTPDTAGR